MSFGEFFKRFMVVLLVLLAWAGIWAARNTLLMGFAAAMIAVGISIPAGLLQRNGLPRGWSLLVSAVGVVFAALALILWIVPPLFEEVTALLNAMPNAVRVLVEGYRSIRAENTFLTAALPEPPTFDTTAISTESARAILDQFLNAGLAIAPTVLGGVGGAVVALVDLVIIFIIAIYFLVDPQSYIKASLFLTPQHYHKRVIDIWNQLHHTARTWVSTLAISITITASLVYIIMGLLLGMPKPMIIAVFAGLATFIPNIGAFLPLIPIALITLTNDPRQILIMVPVYLLIQSLESYIITPSLIKAELKIPGGGLLIFQLLITIAFGALGLLLAVPLLAFLIVLAREIFSFDLLKLRGLTVDLDRDEQGNLTLHEDRTGSLANANDSQRDLA